MINLPDSPLNAPFALLISAGCFGVGMLFVLSDRAFRAAGKEPNERGVMFAFMFFLGAAFFLVMGLSLAFGIITTDPET